MRHANGPPEVPIKGSLNKSWIGAGCFSKFFILPCGTLSAEVFVSSPPNNTDFACVISSWWPGSGPGRGPGPMAVPITVIEITRQGSKNAYDCDGPCQDYAWFKHFWTLIVLRQWWQICVMFICVIQYCLINQNSLILLLAADSSSLCPNVIVCLLFVSWKSS